MRCLRNTIETTQNLKNVNTFRSYFSPFIKYFAAAFFLLLFAGCSSTYRLNKFSSKEKFYEDFNNSAKSKEVKVILLNDSTFTVEDGTVIENDTLFSSERLEEHKIMQLALSDITEVNFERNGTQSVSVLLKNGEEITAENVRTVHDSISLVGAKMVRTKNIISTMDKVKTVSYKNRWRNIPLGAITGLLSGSCIGYFLGKAAMPKGPYVMGGEHDEGEDIIGFFVGAFVGTITGGVLGSAIGRIIIYQFNPEAVQHNNLAFPKE